ncbi:hypothetical protein AB1L30_00985, partial [Bremerella sp. JC817]|uniref:hypothetical protein n=1 Tax=Bremerella sp. JC817 TaxID=3231756 RepID=UPI003459E36E
PKNNIPTSLELESFSRPGGPFLERQAIGRKMWGTECDGGLQIVLPLGQCFIWSGEDRIVDSASRGFMVPPQFLSGLKAKASTASGSSSKVAMV